MRDLALVSLQAEPAAVVTLLFVGDLPTEGVVLAFRTRADGGVADTDSGVPIDTQIDEATVSIAQPAPGIANAYVTAGGPSLCSGDSGSALFVRLDGTLSLIGIFSQSTGVNDGSICTPEAGAEYWVIAASARDWLESIVGPCAEASLGGATGCTFVDVAAPDPLACK
jgi:hypothetical protein